LTFAARVRAGFIPATRREVYAQLKGLRITKCPFVNLPQREPGRWGQSLTAEKMKSCVWLKPETVVRIDFAEWTSGDHLRHPKFAGLRDDKDPKKVVAKWKVQHIYREDVRQSYCPQSITMSFNGSSRFRLCQPFSDLTR
jgi:ATP-dependent DNA ligase